MELRQLRKVASVKPCTRSEMESFSTSLCAMPLRASLSALRVFSHLGVFFGYRCLSFVAEIDSEGGEVGDQRAEVSVALVEATVFVWPPVWRDGALPHQRI